MNLELIINRFRISVVQKAFEKEANLNFENINSLKFNTQKINKLVEEDLSCMQKVVYLGDLNDSFLN